MANGNSFVGWAYIAKTTLGILVLIIGFVFTTSLGDVKDSVRGNGQEIKRVESQSITRDSLLMNRIAQMDSLMNAHAQDERLRDTLTILLLKSISRKLGVDTAEILGDLPR